MVHYDRLTEGVEQRRPLSLAAREHPLRVYQDGGARTGEGAGDQLLGRHRSGERTSLRLSPPIIPSSPLRSSARRLSESESNRRRDPVDVASHAARILAPRGWMHAMWRAWLDPGDRRGTASSVWSEAWCDGRGPLDAVGDPGGVGVEIESDVAVLVVDPREPLVDDLDD
jgi:hypothetical protein